MARISADEMLARYVKLIKQQDPLVGRIDELIQQALAHRDAESDSLAAMRSAIGKAPVNSQAAVNGRSDVPTDQSNTIKDTDTANGKPLAPPQGESGGSAGVKQGDEGFNDPANTGKDMSVAVDKTRAVHGTVTGKATAAESGNGSLVDYSDTSEDSDEAITTSAIEEQAAPAGGLDDPFGPFHSTHEEPSSNLFGAQTKPVQPSVHMPIPDIHNADRPQHANGSAESRLSPLQRLSNTSETPVDHDSTKTSDNAPEEAVTSPREAVTSPTFGRHAARSSTSAAVTPTRKDTVDFGTDGTTPNAVSKPVPSPEHALDNDPTKIPDGFPKLPRVVDGPRLDTLCAAVSSHLAGYVEPRNKFIRTQTLSAGIKSVTSPTSLGPGSPATDDPSSSFFRDSKTSPTKAYFGGAMSSLNEVLEGSREEFFRAESSRKRKSSQAHEAINKSREAQDNDPIVDEPGPYPVYSPLSSTPDSQLRKQAGDYSMQQRIDDLSTPSRSYAESMTAGGKSALSRTSLLSQSSDDMTMHGFTESPVTNGKSLNTMDTEDIFAAMEAVVAAWTGHRLIDISVSTPASGFVNHLRSAMEAAMKRATLKEAATKKVAITSPGTERKINEPPILSPRKNVDYYSCTEFVDLIHATMRSSSAKRLRAGLQQIVNSRLSGMKGCDFSSILNDDSEALKEDTAGSRLKALCQQYNQNNFRAVEQNNGMWLRVQKMTLAYRFISLYEEILEDCDISGPMAAQICEAYIDERQKSGGDARRENESDSELVKLMVGELFRKPGTGTDRFNNLGTTAQQAELRRYNLPMMKACHKIAATCGGPGIFCVLPEKSVAKIQNCRVAFRDDILDCFAQQFPGCKELGELLTKNVLEPVMRDDVEAIKRLPMFDIDFDYSERVLMLTWHELLGLPTAS